MTTLIVALAAAAAAFGSLVFDAVAMYWHHQDRRERIQAQARMALDEARLYDDERQMGIRH